MPDESWKATGTCTDTYKNGDTKFESWEEGSHLKEYTDKITGGTGKYQGVGGGGTYIYENLTDTLSGGTYKGTIDCPSSLIKMPERLRDQLLAGEEISVRW